MVAVQGCRGLDRDVDHIFVKPPKKFGGFFIVHMACSGLINILHKKTDGPGEIHPFNQAR